MPLAASLLVTRSGGDCRDGTGLPPGNLAEARRGYSFDQVHTGWVAVFVAGMVLALAGVAAIRRIRVLPAVGTSGPRRSAGAPCRAGREPPERRR